MPAHHCQAHNKWRSRRLHIIGWVRSCMSSLAHALVGPTLLSQTHLHQRARFRSLRSGRPRPPQSTLSQATKKWPPFVSCRPFHRKARQILRSASKTLGEIYRDIMACTWIKLRVVWTKMVLPPRLRSLAHHKCNLQAALSTMGCSWAAVSFLMLSGRPTYLKGKDPTSQPIICRVNSTYS
jgi:hypothetical protein